MCIIKVERFPEIVKHWTAVFATQGEILLYLIIQIFEVGKINHVWDYIFPPSKIHALFVCLQNSYQVRIVPDTSLYFSVLWITSQYFVHQDTAAEFYSNCGPFKYLQYLAKKYQWHYDNFLL